MRGVIMLDIEIKILDSTFYSNDKIFSSNKPKLNLPTYATKGSAAIDLRATMAIALPPNSDVMIGTGLAIWVKDPNVCALVLPRSGLGSKDGLVLGNLVGLLDSDYQGELKISLWNRSKYPREYKAGAKIAQLVFLPVTHPKMKLVSDFSNNTQRGALGFGSTGL